MKIFSLFATVAVIRTLYIYFMNISLMPNQFYHFLRFVMSSLGHIQLYFVTNYSKQILINIPPSLSSLSFPLSQKTELTLDFLISSSLQILNGLGFFFLTLFYFISLFGFLFYDIFIFSNLFFIRQQQKNSFIPSKFVTELSFVEIFSFIPLVRPLNPLYPK